MPTKNKSNRSKYRRAHYLKNRAKQIAASKLWHQENRERWMAGRRAHRKRLRDAVLVQLGSRCTRCGMSDVRVLQIDHVHGDGKCDRKQHSNGSSPNYLKKVLAAPAGEYQLLCANCNLIKFHEEERPRYEQEGRWDKTKPEILQKYVPQVAAATI